MPNYAYIQIDTLPCPKCLRELTRNSVIGFQWGYCHQRDGFPDYKIGDAIEWRRAKDGTTPAWSYFKSGGGNIGDPKYSNVWIRESEFELRQCSSCGYQFAGIVVRVIDGKIESVTIEQQWPDADVSIATDDGSPLPMPEWDGHPMPVVDKA